MKRFILLPVLFSWSSVSLAGLGRTIPAYEALPNACAFALKIQDGSFHEACSGTLIGPRHILTAAHCLENGLEGVRVFCGPSGAEAEIELSQEKIHPQYDHATAKTDDRMRQYDLALVRLREEVPALALNYARTEKEVTDLLSRARRCGFFGFSGLLSQPLPQGGLVTGAVEVAPASLSRKDGTFLQLNGQTGRGALVEPGDSGGALACETESGWTVIGATSARDYNYNSLFAPLFNLPAEMWAHFSDRTSPQAAREKRQADFSLLAARLEDDLKAIKRSFTERRMALPEAISRTEETLVRLKESADAPMQALAAVAAELDTQKKSFVESLSPGLFRLKTFSLVKLSEENYGRSEVGSLDRERLKRHLNAISIVDLRYNYFRLKSLENGVLRGDLKLFGPSEGFGCTGPFFCSQGVLRDVEIGLEDLTYEVRDYKLEF